MHEDIFLGAITDEVVQYDGSGVVQPGSSKAPVDTSVTNPNTGSDGITPDQEQEDAAAPQNNWIMYLGVGLMAYILLFKNK
jgi:hypothetical protein